MPRCFFGFLFPFLLAWARLGPRGRGPSPSGTPRLFLSFGGDPGCFMGKVMLCGSILLVGIDLPVTRSTFLCGSDNSLAAFSCFGLLFLEFPMTCLRLSLVLVYFSLHFR